MKQTYLDWKGRFLMLAIFAIAMGFLEAIVVVYLRELYYPGGFEFPLRLMSSELVTAEWIRETATLVMLAMVGIIAGRNGLQRLFFALFAFGIWDIVYYVALNLLLGWPVSLLTWDLLFLIPVSWLGPVLAPVINSLTMILMAILFIGRQEKGYYIRLGISDWILIISGSLVILYTYLVDYTKLLIESGVLSARGSPDAAERLVEMITNYIPHDYNWPLFIAGEALILAATINVLIRSQKNQKMKQLTNLTAIMLLLILTGCRDRKSGDSANNDPYIWLEEVQNEKALDWAREQNRLSDEALTTLPLYTELREKFLEVFNDRERIIYPGVTGEMSYNLWQDAKNERGLWRRMTKQDYLAGKDNWETVLDLDLLSAEEGRKWVFGGATWLGPENRYCLLSLSDGGKDEAVIREFDAVEKKFVDGGFSVAESKGSVAWVNKDQIVVATNYGPGTMTSSGYPAVAKLWKRGEDPVNAAILHQTDTTNMGLFVSGRDYKGKQYVFLNESVGFYESTISLLTPEGLKLIDIPKDVETNGMCMEEMLLYLQSDWDVNGEIFKRGTLVSFDLPSYLSGKTSVKTIYEPAERASLAGVMASRDFIVVATMENVQGKLTVFRPVDGKWVGEAVPVPEFGTAGLAGSEDQSNDWFFTFSNPATPTTIYYADGTDIKAIRKQKDYYDASRVKVDQYEAISKDGTKIPYFIVHPADMAFDGSNPALVYGYGGFNSSTRPGYSSVTGIGWIEKGGVYVIANIRGGGEFGPAWHQSALREKRQNAYDDFFAVAEDLIKRKITSPEHMGAYGWSNGGLLAGVALTQRPDLWNAVVIGAPLLDMKRYSKLLAGASWMDEYGNPDVPADWEFISKYSPYQNVKKDVKYPTPLFITSTRDDRVHPGHARKMAAKMIDMGHPVYYHETIEGGHGASSTNAQEAEMRALMYTYLQVKLMN